MWKLVLAGAMALVLSGSSTVYAQQRPGGPERPRWQLSQEDIAAFAEARIAALKAGLVLTAEQEKSWPAFETALRDLARYRTDRRAARQTREPAQDPTERLRRYADALSGYGAVIKKLADAQAPLYNSLDEAQKRRFAVLVRPMGQSRGWHRRGPHGMWRGGLRERGAPGYQRRGVDGRGGEDGRGRDWRNGGDDDGRRDRRGTTREGERL